MGKKLELVDEKNKRNRTLLAKIGNIVLSSGVLYNANKTCVTNYLPYNMCSTTMGSSIQVKYIKS
jgi:hypothetical protein